MSTFDHIAVERKWQERWARHRVFQQDLRAPKKPFYNLMMFPYPSAEGLHVGNVYAFTAADVFGRFKRMTGYDVFEPMGFDAFGMHSENYAIKQGIHPAKLTPRSIKNFRENQLARMGGMFDWEHSVDTTSPDYYKWTQWIFIQLYKAGLAYQKEAPVNWCPSCRIVLSDELCQDGACERCHSEVHTRQMRQWFFAITKYARRLLDNLPCIDWSESTRAMQTDWIGASEGAHIRFQVIGLEEDLEVYTTRPDTLFGATYMVCAPELDVVDKITTDAHRDEVCAYVAAAKRKTKADRMKDKDKTGVFTGGYAINPANGARIPIWISDYVLMGYGTGAIMAVPAHDTRDFAFAKKFNLPIIEVISEDGGAHELAEAYTGEGILVNSGPFNGRPSLDAMREVTQFLAGEGRGKAAQAFKLRDWCISRQRYWGPPIPMILCDKCGIVPVPDADLPVILPEIENIEPDSSGLPVLARSPEFLRVTCPSCGGQARRETDVSDNFLDSAWYFLHYPSTEFADRPFDPDITRTWLPVDSYIGGNEHARLHLLYVRFITMVLHDLGHLDFEEPFKKFRAHGMLVRWSDERKKWDKISKSRGNVINPDEFFEKFGADTLRMFLMFLSPIEPAEIKWTDEGILGPKRFLDRVWAYATADELVEGMPEDRKMLRAIHQTIRKATQDFESLKFNTAIASMMDLMNVLEKATAVPDPDGSMKSAVVRYAGVADILSRLICPLAPHMAEEIRERLGMTGYCSVAPWPEFDEELCRQDSVTVVLQVNGKVRGRIEIDPSLPAEEVLRIAREDEKVKKYLEGGAIADQRYIPGRLVSFAVK